MEYLIPGALVLIVIAAGIGLLLRSARAHGRRGRQAADDPDYGAGVPGTDTAIVAADPDSPLGDTSEHAGEQRDGETVAGQDADRSGGSRRPAVSGSAGTPAAGRDGEHASQLRTARPLIGGEGEGTRRR